ncbi:MAG: hypothetical protein ACOYMN_12845, partial [Roseimicrobium sp.]
MPSYNTIDADTVAEIVSAAGANSQEQKWAAQVAVNSMGQNPWVKLMGGVMGGKPIQVMADTNKLKGQVVNLQVEAPLGGTGRQGSGEQRIGYGEDTKFKMWQFQIGAQWHGVKANRISLAQTVLGKGSFDSRARSKLSEWFAARQGSFLEACLLAAKTARTTLFCNNKQSVEALRSADVFYADTAKKVSDLMAANMARPLAVARGKTSGQTIKKYFIQGNSRLYDSLHQSDTWQTLLANSDIRGSENQLFFGGLPSWAGCVLDETQIEVNTADGPQGSFAAPIAYTGSAVIALPATGAELLGGGSAAAGGLTDRLYFEYFQGAQYKKFDREVIAATTGTEYYFLIRNLTGADAGKFGMYAYQVNNGNKLVLTKALRSTAATSGKIDQTTVGNVTWNSGVWTTSVLTNTHPIGSEIIPCNSYGQPFVCGYSFGDEAMISGFGSVDGEIAMGRRTFEDKDHGREYEIGNEMVWGAAPT